MDDLKVKDIMTHELVTLQEDEDIDLANTVMQLGRIRHLPVVREGRLVGLVTHRDILAAQVSTVADVSPSERQVINRCISAAQIMAQDVTTIDPQASVLEAARVMRDHKYGCLPVVQDGLLVGLITEADFLDLLVALLTRPSE